MSDFNVRGELFSSLLNDVLSGLPRFHHPFIALGPSRALRGIPDVVSFSACLLQTIFDLVETLRLQNVGRFKLLLRVRSATLALVNYGPQWLEEKLVQNQHHKNDRGADRKERRQVWKILHYESGERGGRVSLG